MEMAVCVSSSIELKISSDGINSDICNKLIFINDMDEYYYITYVYNIVIICEYWNKLLYVLLVSIWRWTII